MRLDPIVIVWASLLVLFIMTGQSHILWYGAISPVPAVALAINSGLVSYYLWRSLRNR